jgi:hypothetical protein
MDNLFWDDQSRTFYLHSPSRERHRICIADNACARKILVRPLQTKFLSLLQLKITDEGVKHGSLDSPPLV